MDEPKQPPRSVKVVDRRKFTADGNLREELRPAAEKSEQAEPDNTNHAEPDNQPAPDQGESAHPPDTQSAPPGPEAQRGGASRPSRPAQPPTGPAGPAAERGTPSSSQHFLELVTMVAQNAEILIAGAEGLPARPQDARRMIDWLAALEEKTAGNLSAEESQLLSGAIFQLRSLYLQSQR